MSFTKSLGSVSWSRIFPRKYHKGLGDFFYALCLNSNPLDKKNYDQLADHKYDYTTYDGYQSSEKYLKHAANPLNF